MRLPSLPLRCILLVICFNTLPTSVFSAESCDTKSCSHDCVVEVILTRCQCGDDVTPQCKDACANATCEDDACAVEHRDFRPRCVCPDSVAVDPDDVTKCIDNPCDGSAPRCRRHCDTDGGEECSCPHGYAVVDDAFCQDIDECVSDSPCKHTCDNTYGSYTCTCPPGYELDHDDMHSCKDVDECKDSPCEHHCDNTQGGFSCACEEGFVAEGDKCIDVNECVTIAHCPQLCVDGPGGYTCECFSGYRRTDGHGECVNIDECSEGRHGCEQKCDDVSGSYVCACHPGFVADRQNRSKCIEAVEYSARLVFNWPLARYSGMLDNKTGDVYTRLRADMRTSIYDVSEEFEGDIVIKNMYGSLEVECIFKMAPQTHDFEPGSPDNVSAPAMVARLVLSIASRGVQLPGLEQRLAPGVFMGEFQVFPDFDVCDVREAIQPCDSGRGLHCDVMEGGACREPLFSEESFQRDTIIVLAFTGVCLLGLVCFLIVCCTVNTDNKDSIRSKSPFGDKINTDVSRLAFEENGVTSMYSRW